MKHLQELCTKFNTKIDVKVLCVKISTREFQVELRILPHNSIYFVNANIFVYACVFLYLNQSLQCNRWLTFEKTSSICIAKLG